MDRVREHRGEGVAAPHRQAVQPQEEDVHEGEGATGETGDHHVQHGRLLPALRHVRQGSSAGGHLRTGLFICFCSIFYF